MDIRDFNKAIKKQEEFAASLTKKLKKLQSDHAPSMAATIEEQEQLIKSAKDQLVTVKKERGKVIATWDKKVEEGSATLKRLEKGLIEMKERIPS